MALTSTFIANKSAPHDVRQYATGYIKGTYTAATVNSATAKAATAAEGASTGGIANADAVDNMVIASGVATITLGFKPKYVKVINVTDRLTQEWFDGMNVGDFLETAANGTVTLETDDKLSVAAATGVITITFDGGAATDNDTMVFEAVG